jgi:hypothetical protein
MITLEASYAFTVLYMRELSLSAFRGLSFLKIIFYPGSIKPGMYNIASECKA